MSCSTGLFFILFDDIVDDCLIPHLPAEVLHSLGVAVRAMIGADAGGGEVQGIDFQTLFARDELGAETATSAAGAGLVANPDWYFQGLVASDQLGDDGQGFAGESESSAGVLVILLVGELGD